MAKIAHIRPDQLSQQLLESMDDEHFRLLVQTVAEMFKRLKTEAIRRGIWDELKGMKVQ